MRNKLTGEPWEQDTMVLVYSATKGLAATASTRILMPPGIAGVPLLTFDLGWVAALCVVIAAIAVTDSRRLLRQPLRRWAA